MIARLDGYERSCAAAIGAAAIGFGVYGITTGAPSTAAYVLTVLVLGSLVTAVRRGPLPPALLAALVALTIAHLAGGLVRVGDDVLYNARFGSPVLQYDHFVHAFGVLVGTLMLAVLLRPARAIGSSRSSLILLLMLGGLGLGALNEAVEFVTTLAHHGTHVGGYENTGWDLVSNIVGASVAGLVLCRQTA